MQKLLITGGRVVDPQNSIDEVADVLVENGKIVFVGAYSPSVLSSGSKDNTPLSENIETIDATGQIVCPGLIDLQVHLREPGREDREDIESGLSAAVAGGFTAVVTMPNTQPVADNEAVILHQLRRADEVNLARLYPAASISVEQKGKHITQMRELKKVGAIAVTDDGVDVQSAGLLENAMEWALTFDLPLLSHCEEESLHGRKGVMHEGKVSTELGLPPISAMVEDYGVMRNVLLAQKTGVRFHALHCSTAGGLDTLRQFKQQNSRITCESCPQYFALTDEVVRGYNTLAKMYPPIRSEEHRQAVIKAFQDDTIDCITTDHAPHRMCEKELSFVDANWGSVGLETSLALSYTYLVAAGHISLSKLIEKMSLNPAKVIGVEGGHLSVGAAADITIFDPEVKWTVNPEEFKSKGRNCLFEGMEVQGKTTCTIVGGEVKFQNGEVVR
jgi:dihydroorotase